MVGVSAFILFSHTIESTSYNVYYLISTHFTENIYIIIVWSFFSLFYISCLMTSRYYFENCLDKNDNSKKYFRIVFKNGSVSKLGHAEFFSSHPASEYA